MSSNIKIKILICSRAICERLVLRGLRAKVLELSNANFEFQLGSSRFLHAPICEYKAPLFARPISTYYLYIMFRSVSILCLRMRCSAQHTLHTVFYALIIYDISIK